MTTFRRGPLLLLFSIDNRTSELMAAHFADAPLTPADYGVMSALRLIQPARPTELAATLGMRPTTLSNYLNRLRARDLVLRAPHPTDGRAALLTLTPEGERLTVLCDPHFQSTREALVQALDGLGLDTDEVTRTLETLDRALEEATGRCRSVVREAARITG